MLQSIKVAQCTYVVIESLDECTYSCIEISAFSFLGRNPWEVPGRWNICGEEAP